MSEPLPAVYLARHGETAWSLSGQHTGLTDLPLTERGEHNARRLGERLQGHTFARVFTSPLQRTTYSLPAIRDYPFNTASTNSDIKHRSVILSEARHERSRKICF